MTPGDANSDTLLQRSFDNNLVWLRSFGCRVDVAPGRVNVWHDALEDFRALVIVPAPDLDCLSPCQVSLLGATRDRLAIYLDQLVVPMWAGLLSAQGYAAKGASDVRVMRLHAGSQGEAPVRIERARSTTMDQWSALYSEVFERQGDLARLDRDRWRLAAACEQVAQYFFVEEDVRIGVCQLCESSGIAGLYSVGFLKRHRARGILRRAVARIAGTAASHGLDQMYFERALRDGKPVMTTARGTRPSRVLRTYEMWLWSREVPID